jgi:anti-sigma factor RsiW
MPSDQNLSEWDAAYLLGALTPEELEEYERFRAAKPADGAEQAKLAGAVGLLDLLSPDEALALLDETPTAQPRESGASLLPTLAAAAEKRRLRSRRAIVAGMLASAAAFLVIGGVIGYTAIPQPEPVRTELQAMAPGQRDGLTASLAVSGEPWGTRLDWECRYTKPWATDVAGYDLVVITRDGAEATVASWRPAGEEATGMAASTLIPTTDIRAVEIREAGTPMPLATTTLA